MEVERARAAFGEVKAALVAAAPFVSSLLARVRVVATPEVPTAAVSESDELLLNPKFFLGLDGPGRAWVLAHEALHIAFQHLPRRGERDGALWNVAADVVVNEVLTSLLRRSGYLEGFMVTAERVAEAVNVDIEEVARMEAEEIYDLLAARAARARRSLKCEPDLQPGRGSGQGQVIQEGDPELYRAAPSASPSERGERWREVVAKAYTTQKMAGRVPEALERAVSGLLQPKVDWRSLLRQALREGLGRVAVSTWLRPSRKHRDFPGIRRFTVPTVHCLIDCSGSISMEELAQFITEVFSIAKLAELRVIAWDTKVQVERKVRAPSGALEVARMLRGGGGTTVRPALETLLQKMRPGDVVVLFTDGEIYDADEEATRALFREVAVKASTAVICSTYRELQLPGWRFIKL